MGERFVTCALEEIVVGEALPVDLYIFINFRFLTYKLAGDKFDLATYERFEFKKVKNLFILEKDQPRFEEWARHNAENLAPTVAPDAELTDARLEARRQALDIFRSPHPDKRVEQTMTASKALVQSVLRSPLAVKSLSQLQTYSRDTAEHSVNVSILSVYLAMQMGYSHNLILQHVATGALLHDVGKTIAGVSDDDDSEGSAKKLEEHPTLGLRVFDSSDRVPGEVRMIVAQHHENFDGSGYPKKLRGSAIYDLSRIVSIANIFDELVVDATGSLLDRQRVAVKALDSTLFKHFDPQKLDKALKILKLGI